MTDQLVMNAPERESHEIYPIYFPESESFKSAKVHVGAFAIHIHSLSEMSPVEQIDINRGTDTMADKKNTSHNPEGIANGKLYEQALEGAIHAIESAYKADSTELGDELAIVLASIDTLSATPYISSAPEFVDLVNAARKNVEQAHSSITSNSNPEINSTTLDALSQARQLIAATTVAYRP